MRRFALWGDRRDLAVVMQGNPHEVAWTLAALAICVVTQAAQLSPRGHTITAGREVRMRPPCGGRPSGNLGQRASTLILGPALARRDQYAEAQKIEDVTFCMVVARVQGLEKA